MRKSRDICTAQELWNSLAEASTGQGNEIMYTDMSTIVTPAIASNQFEMRCSDYSNHWNFCTDHRARYQWTSLRHYRQAMEKIRCG